MSITEVTILHHVAIVLLLLWLLSSFNCCHPVSYALSLIYLYMVHEHYEVRLRRKLKFEERREANQKRVLSDSETVRWLNHAVERMWPICMEQVVSQKLLLPVVPWFLQKYKPWTAKEVILQNLYLGRSPPMFTEMRVLQQSPDDDHLVLELGMNFLTADDMSAILNVKLKKRLGLGMSTKLHLTGMHIEGKVLVGVKFLQKWPFLGRLRICFVEPPYFQMNIKPIFNHGIDVTELPGIAGWLDKLMTLALEQTLVKPNMLVVDVGKLVSPQSESWFTIDAEEPIAHALVEVVEATDLQPSDLNGLADPYVKGQLGLNKFRTKTQKKTLTPKWHEEFKIPIFSWETANVITIEVYDKDHFVDDMMGDCSVNLDEFRDGQRHDMWLLLQNIKTGRVHLAITVLEGNEKIAIPVDWNKLDSGNKKYSFSKDAYQQSSFSSEVPQNSHQVADNFEPINVEGQRETGIWVHRPGSEVAQIWESRKGKNRLLDSQMHRDKADSVSCCMSSGSGTCYNDSSSTDESLDGNKVCQENPVRRGLHKISSVFRRSPRREDKSKTIEEPLLSPHVNIKAMDASNTLANFQMEENLLVPPSDTSFKGEGKGSPPHKGPDSPGKRGQMKHVARNILKHAGKSASGIRLSIQRRVSQRKRDELGSEVPEKDVLLEFESSDDESVPSSADTPRTKGELVASNPTSGIGSDIDSCKVQECFKERSLNDTKLDLNAETATKSLVEDLEKSNAEQPGRSEGNEELVFGKSERLEKVSEA